MSMFDYEPIIEKMPGKIEAIEAIHLAKMPQSVEAVMEAAKASGAPQFVKDAEEYERVIGINADYMRKFCGQEGDKGTESGSLQGIVTIAKKLRIAVGGE